MQLLDGDVLSRQTIHSQDAVSNSNGWVAVPWRSLRNKVLINKIINLYHPMRRLGSDLQSSIVALRLPSSCSVRP